MQRNGKTGVGGCLPNGVVDRVVERSPVHRRVGPHEHRHHAGQLSHPADLRGHAGHVLAAVHWGHRAGAEEAPLALLYVVRAPVVVGAGLGLGEVNIPLALQAEQQCGIQHGQIDVVLVHVLKAGLCVPAGGTGLGVAQLTPQGACPILVAHSGRTGGRLDIGRSAVAVVDHPLLAGLVGLDVPDAIAVLGRRVLGNGRRVFEDVAVRIDVTQPICDRHEFLPP